ncbi:hypothetical protein [Streptacidiphilus anmyonensis]|uniref:hypothetical protein n=1 Tax=Streptacidiphilus anmyonensis TaxID=405782 RepID=UPI00128D7BBC|nr:hypothetical protein [Streptacidiphilus anmyonensis]
MYGPPPVMGHVPPSRRVSAWRVVGWVLLAGCLIGGVGLVACVPLTVLAVRSRTRRDASLAVAALVFTAFACTVTAQSPDPNHPGPLASVVSLGLLAQGIATTVYFIRCDRLRARQLGAPVFPGAGPAPMLQPYPADQPHRPDPQYRIDAQYRLDEQYQPHPSHQQPPLPTVALPVAPMPVQPDRLGQVRAELDELSDYLRKEQGS